MPVLKFLVVFSVRLASVEDREKLVGKAADCE